METLKAIGGFLFILIIIGFLVLIWCPNEWVLPIIKVQCSMSILFLLIFIFDKSNNEDASAN